jgi:ZU5 domain
MRARFLGYVVAGMSLALASCSTSESVAPPPVAASPAAAHSLTGSLTGVLTSPVTIQPLQRTVPLATDASASAYIGVLGGTISIPSAGITVIVPALALPKPTRITVTALAGSNVAYEFAPHGIKFPVPLVVVQSLTNTQAQTGGLVDPLSLRAGYFPDSTNVTSVTELLGVDVNLLGQTAAFSVWHFSGYILAGG